MFIHGPYWSRTFLSEIAKNCVHYKSKPKKKNPWKNPKIQKSKNPKFEISKNQETKQPKILKFKKLDTI